MSVRRMQQEYDVTVRWRAFPLHPDIPPDGMDYVAYFGGEAAWADAGERVSTMAALLGVPFRMPQRKYNSRRAEELTAWAVTGAPDRLDALRDRIFRAIWAEGVDNGDAEVLIDVAMTVGIQRDAAVEALEQRKGRVTVDEDWRESLTRGISGVPVAFIGKETVMGAQPWTAFAGAIERAGIQPHPGSSPDESR